MQKTTFVTLAVPGKSILKALMMGNSLRDFGGELKDSPIWILVPEGNIQFSNQILEKISTLNAEIVVFEISPNELRFPFASKVAAAAHAEANLMCGSNLLVWLDSDNIILREPDEFLLPGQIYLGYRPVHHKLIGPTWGQPLDPFWNLIYQSCQVPKGQQFQMTTHTGEKSQPYFNAGTFVIRPERQLMAKWRKSFTELMDKPEFQVFYKTDNRYIIFFHQAVFTGVLLHELERPEMLVLSSKINYPLHLHAEIPVDRRPRKLVDLTSVRYENIFDTKIWHEELSILQPIHPWLNDQLLIHNASENPG
jgi:hypothetical protein